MPSSPDRSVVLSWKTRNWKILPLVPTACTVMGRSNTRWGSVWDTHRGKARDTFGSTNTLYLQNFLVCLMTPCYMSCVYSYPVLLVCPGQGVSKGEHNHLGPELFWAELIASISSFQEVNRVGMRVRVALPETWQQRRHLIRPEQWT